MGALTFASLKYRTWMFVLSQGHPGGAGLGPRGCAWRASILDEKPESAFLSDTLPDMGACIKALNV
jgi:hypothetical protein